MYVLYFNKTLKNYFEKKCIAKEEMPKESLTKMVDPSAHRHTRMRALQTPHVQAGLSHCLALPRSTRNHLSPLVQPAPTRRLLCAAYATGTEGDKDKAGRQGDLREVLRTSQLTTCSRHGGQQTHSEVWGMDQGLLSRQTAPFLLPVFQGDPGDINTMPSTPALVSGKLYAEVSCHPRLLSDPRQITALL